MSAMLYLVPTPIGNLSDISERCREVLAQADFIAAEDTRVTLRLLNHLELKKPLVSYYEHNKAASGPRTMICYEAPHKLCATLRDLAAAFGGERRISLCRELTKLHEEVLRLTLDGAVAYYETQPPRGEYVLIVEGAPKQQESGPVSEEEALMRVQALLAEGLSRKDAVRQVAAETGLAKNQLYDAALRAQHTETE